MNQLTLTLYKIFQPSITAMRRRYCTWACSNPRALSLRKLLSFRQLYRQKLWFRTLSEMNLGHRPILMKVCTNQESHRCTMVDMSTFQLRPRNTTYDTSLDYLDPQLLAKLSTYLFFYRCLAKDCTYSVGTKCQRRTELPKCKTGGR